MKRFRRRVFNVFAALSLLLCPATLALWIESEFASDFFYRADSTSQISVTWGAGELSLIFNQGPAGSGPSRSEWHFNHMVHGISFAHQVVESLGQGRSLSKQLGLLLVHHAKSASWGGQMSLVSIPFWFLVLVSCVLPLVWAGEARRIYRRQSTGHCPNCGYDLRATPNRCPECGTIPSRAQIVSS
jgi:hypothetical protein